MAFRESEVERHERWRNMSGERAQGCGAAGRAAGIAAGGADGVDVSVNVDVNADEDMSWSIRRCEECVCCGKSRKDGCCDRQC